MGEGRWCCERVTRRMDWRIRMVSEVSERRTRRESLRVRRGLEGMLLVWFGLVWGDWW